MITWMSVFVVFLLIWSSEETVYLLDTEDGSSVEFYDCISHSHFHYCRRPSSPLDLARHAQLTGRCDNNGVSHSFASLASKNITLHTILHRWGSSVEMAEEYARYLQVPTSKSVLDGERSLCQCANERSFGKQCEYLLATGGTFQVVLEAQGKIREVDNSMMQLHGEIICYTTLICDSGLLCLDWRDICDGVQQCMFGYDEENCDKLEFNECDEEEYRCLNGMCIPEQFFLDSDYDCSDLSDEKEVFDEKTCTFEAVSVLCDDRSCPPTTWSCGDGQCIVDRLAFESDDDLTKQCLSERDQYFLCERHSMRRQWTLPNGRCYTPCLNHPVPIQKRSLIGECEYFLKCAFSYGADEKCPCGSDMDCINALDNPCDSPTVQYPKGGILAPYIFHLYNTDRDWSDPTPDWLVINGSIKCRGYTITQSLTIPYPSKFHLGTIEQLLCNSTVNSIVELNRGYDLFCNNHSRTFNNRSYHFVDVCEESRECFSAYRIGDGDKNCADERDEHRPDLVLQTCSRVKHHRLRCSTEKTTCLPVSQISSLSSDYQSLPVSSSLGKAVSLLQLSCSHASKDDCQLIRQYLLASWTGTLPEVRFTHSMVFRAYCDTWWNLAAHADENPSMCQPWWICSEGQWRCRSGQCIDRDFVLDTVWDCSDASDEEAILYSPNAFAPRNTKLISANSIERKFANWFAERPFLNMCNATSEFSCYRIGASSFVRDQLCISLEKLGDGVVDCLGGVDERNTMEYCARGTILGENYKCLTTNTCVAYADVCDLPCPNRSDDHILCPDRETRPNCSDLIRDFPCWNGQCAKNGWCDGKVDCLYGEDEYLCVHLFNSLLLLVRSFRQERELQLSYKSHSFQLPNIPHGISSVLRGFHSPNVSKSVNSTSRALVFCNRGVGILLENDSIVCFCPYQYYGEKCQFHSDRVTLILQLNFSRSIYEECIDPSIELKLLVLFLLDNQILQTQEFYVRPALERVLSPKRITHLLYSRSNQSLEKKRQRYFNRSSVISQHPFSIRIEGYQMKIDRPIQLIALWQYPIYFDYLPNFRLVKVLRLSGSNPCRINPCNENQTCHSLFNQPGSSLCLCRDDRRGKNCETVDRMCSEGFCSSNGLCKPNYRSVLRGNVLPYCLCSNQTWGRRCHLPRDQCNSNPCRNNASCYPNGTSTGYICLCHSLHWGDECQETRRAVNFFINRTVEHRGAVVQFFYIDFAPDDLRLVHQQAFLHLPDRLQFLHGASMASELAVVKLYLDGQVNGIYLISAHDEIVSFNATIELNEKLRCVDVQTLFNTSEEIVPFKYHSRCINNTNLLCFLDETYLCICTKDHSRVECFNYDRSLDQCSSCSINGLCLAGDRTRSKDFICVCRRCHYGHLCQYSTEQLSFTLDSLIVDNHFGIQLFYLLVATLIFCVGGMTNYASFVTFQRPTPRKVGVGNYLLVVSLVNQISLFFLLCKVSLILFASFSGDLPCKLITYFLSVTTRYSYWLTSWLTLDRVHMTIFPFSAMHKKPHSALRISWISALLIALMHVHELLFYVSLQDISRETVCVNTMTSSMSLYNRITVLTHFIVPFGIQLVSITLLIVFAARSRSQTAGRDAKFIEHLRQQFHSRKELYLTPAIIILSGLPQAILSFRLACMDWSAWQRHTLLAAYFLSYAPQVLGFVLFVLPSTTYLKEFRSTRSAEMRLYRWTLTRNKPKAVPKQLLAFFASKS